MQIKIEQMCHNETKISVGEEVGSYSGGRVFEDEKYYVSSCSGMKGRVVLVDYKQLALYIHFYDQDFILEIQEITKDQWAEKILEKTMTEIAKSGQIPSLIMMMASNCYNRGVAEGRKQKISELKRLFEK